MKLHKKLILNEHYVQLSPNLTKISYHLSFSQTQTPWTRPHSWRTLQMRRTWMWKNVPMVRCISRPSQHPQRRGPLSLLRLRQKLHFLPQILLPWTRSLPQTGARSGSRPCKKIATTIARHQPGSSPTTHGASPTKEKEGCRQEEETSNSEDETGRKGESGLNKKVQTMKMHKKKSINW